MRKQLLLIVLSLLVIVGGGAGIYFGVFSEDPVVTSEEVPVVDGSQTGSTTDPEIVENSRPKYQGQALRFIGSDPVVKTLAAEIIAEKKVELNKFAEIAEKNPSDSLAWLKISEIKKFFNNYKGSVDALEYIKLTSPDDFLVNLNLGNLYGFYLKDYKRAEQNFANAMNHSGGDQLVAAISALADLYKDFYKEKYDQVDDLLLIGIEAIPSDVNLVMKLAFYYKEVNNKEGAIQSFERLLSMPGLTGAQQQAFEAEIAALKKA
ncbi:MAG: hypothetical protein G01um101419_280 [Parcubacteria group bacterium Gr01-1014_19]|nr:MAG: hypothetical protein G01um101419_280 [Parcubacteria group bacterium Gr01-1014_19]